MKILKNDNSLSKGIFWVKNVDDIAGSMLYFTVECDSNGKVFSTDNLTSKSGTSFNHKQTWASLPSNVTNNKKFDYYPRGRVEISHGRAIIYCSRHIATEELIDVCKERFHLTSSNGITKIRMIIDGSEHYKCYLDTV